jgi:very-short-patch-repair endonuclease
MAAEREVVPHIGQQLRIRRDVPVDLAIAELAARQHGVVSLWQLLELGLTLKVVQHRIARGLLHPVHRGVYAVGHPALAREGEWMAAVLAASGFLSHRPAAELHRIVERRARGTIDVSVMGTPGKRPGIRIHRATHLTDADVMVIDGIPVTNVAWTLVDLAAREPRSLEGAFGRAERRGLLDLLALDRALARGRGRRGVGRVRALRAEFEPTSEYTRSELERRFIALCRRHRLPRPKVNLWISVAGDGFEVDFCWPEARLILETDSEWHDDTLARKRDARRDELLVAAGWLVIRVRWHDVVEAQAATAERIRRVLIRRGRSCSRNSGTTSRSAGMNGGY